MIQLLMGLTALATPPQPLCPAYRFERLRDTGRSYIEGGKLASRPVDLAIWYPARCSGPTVTLRELAVDSAVQAGRAPSMAKVGDEHLEEELGAVDTHVLSSPSGSRRGAAPAAPSPLVVYLHPSAIEAAPVAERLAKIGFAVAAVRWRGTYTQEFDAGSPGMLSELMDAQLAVRHMIDKGLADGKRMHVIGTSFGAITAVCLAQSDMRIASIVSHDGGIVTAYGSKVLAQCPWYETRRPLGALLSFYDARFPDITFAATEPLSNLRAQQVAVPDLDHADYFGTARLRLAADPKDASIRRKVERFDRLADQTVAFIACIHQDREASCPVSPPAGKG